MALNPLPKAKNPNEPGPLLRALRLGYGPFAFAALFGLVSNLLYLALPLYTNQVYSRVLTSHSLPTLMVLTLGAAFVFLVSSVIDHYRAQVLTGFGVVFDAQLASRTFAALFDAAVRRQGTRSQSLRDLDTVRQAVSGPAIGALFDVPWIPIFLLILFIIDPLIGAITFFGGIFLVVFTILQERATKEPMKEATNAALQSYVFTDAALRNGEVVRALGMLPTLGRQWARLRHISVAAGVRSGERTSFYSGSIRFVRMLIQILTVAAGAYLVMERSIPSGMLFANMILASRALAPIERIVGSWRILFEAMQSYRRLEATLEGYEPPVPVTQLPVPQGGLTVENVSFAPQGAAALTLINLNFRVNPGDFVGIAGPSGAGKSTLARLLCGIWKPNSGTVRLDGADVYTWDREDFGHHVAYLPQDTELFTGTVRDNICRFRPEATDEEVVKAAQTANAHEMILRLPKGYETELGEGGQALSAGQRQRVGLARTVFGDPKVVVLDEPNANLDNDGEAALNQAMARMKERGATVIVISHKTSAFEHADKILLLNNGQMAGYGPREEIVKALTERRQAALQAARTRAVRPPAAPPGADEAPNVPAEARP
ncbi:type I secretion system permease/ATPase [Sphingomonas quercus]|uniref:Type I secretion system permease/ATPase n=1 Tax=Sphingomonas quercus TaxID=2842451 RepID=A0ABS6BHB7_9SPHN|nr:type I secretion system permease/ATPase [Sphingomonas quercus]MBU3076987.1 type I secretion system permease/ATPase [Sphingomonas quercus]